MSLLTSKTHLEMSSAHYGLHDPTWNKPTATYYILFKDSHFIHQHFKKQEQFNTGIFTPRYVSVAIARWLSLIKWQPNYLTSTCWQRKMDLDIFYRKFLKFVNIILVNKTLFCILLVFFRFSCKCFFLFVRRISYM